MPPAPRSLADRLRFRLRLAAKWRADRRALPLTPAHWELYRNIHRTVWHRLGRFPELVAPRTRNDALQWIKLFDQRPEHVTCCDKVAVRDYIRARLGDGHTVPLLQVARHFDELDLDALPRAFVLKASHDSGSAIVVRDRATFDRDDARRRLEAALRRRYGWDKGEWPYDWVPRRILVEECLEPEAVSPPPDWKFHCSNGRVLWCGYHYERNIVPRLVQVDRDGVPLPFREAAGKWQPGEGFVRPDRWAEMLALAERLAEGLRMVRVDLYLSGDRILVGELTLWPVSGCSTATVYNIPDYVGDVTFDDPRPLLHPTLGPRAIWPHAA